jgi:intraflagellar transport protein 74
LQEEVTKINNEINDIAQDSELYQSLEKRYEQLVKTVRALEGDLADHNLATDKLRTDPQPEDVHHMYLIMKQQNEQQKSDVDQIFLEKRSHEEEIQRMVQEEKDITRKAEERLNELHPDQRREYEGLREENQKLSKELTDGREELEQVSSRLNALEGHLRSDVMRARSQQLQVVHKEAMERLQILEQEVRQCSMPVPEQREILLNKVKTDNAEIVAAEKRNSELKLEKERLKAQIKEVMTDAQERKDEGGDQQKYEILFAKDQEMSQFISSFDEHKAEEEAKMKEKQENIIRLLENISIALGLHNITPEGHLAEMEDELKFKVGQLQNSETTQNRLEAEQNKRQGELEKIESLDLKITQELQQVNAKMEQYENDIKNKYDRVSEMQGEGGQKIKQLEERKLFLEGRLSTLKQQVGFLRLRHESRRQQLADDETASAIEAQEQKIRQFGQTLFTLQSFIKQKSSESDFQYEMATCLQAANELNKILQERRPSPCA